MNDEFPNCSLSLLRRMKWYKCLSMHWTFLLMCAFVVFWFLPMEIYSKKTPDLIIGTCPEFCLVKMCKMYTNLNDYSHGPCSCDRMNSNNVTSTFCSDYQTTPYNKSDDQLSYVTVIFMVILTCMFPICLVAACCAGYIPKYYLDDIQLFNRYLIEHSHDDDPPEEMEIELLQPLVV